MRSPLSLRVRVVVVFFVVLVVCAPLVVSGLMALVNAYELLTSSSTICWEWSSTPVVLCLPDTDDPLSFLGRAAIRLAIAVGIVWLGAYWALRPLRGLTDTVRVMGPTNLGQRIAPTGPHDDAYSLAVAIDDLMDRVANGYEAQRRFAANASHELRTPLAVQRTLVEVALEDPDTAPHLDRLARQLLRTNERNENLIEGLVALADADRGLVGAQPVRLDDIAARALHEALPYARGRQVELALRRSPCLVLGDEVLLERLLTNLVRNAVRYNHDGGRVDVEVGTDHGTAALTVTNTGDPVPPEVVPSLFEPFRRLSPERTGTSGGAGLGLSIVRSIADAHHGSVTATARAEGGLVVVVSLPAADEH